jgi:hypothetical protein
MPNSNPGDNRLGWSVNAGNNSGGLQRGIFGAALNALGQARRTEVRLHEFDYKENAKRETYLQRKAADQAGHVMKSKTNEETALKVARLHKDKPNFNYNGANGSISYSIPSTYTEDMKKIAQTNQETERLKNERAREKTASSSEPGTGGTKKGRSTKKAEATKNADDAWAATAPSTPSRTTSNVTPPTVTAPKPRKPRASRAPGAPSGFVPATPGSALAKVTKNGKAMS